MKKIGIIAALAAALTGSGAYAADVFGRGDSLKDSGPVSAARSWQGPYVALGGGYRWHNWDSVGQTILGSDAKCTDALGNPSGRDGDQSTHGVWDGTEEHCDGKTFAKVDGRWVRIPDAYQGATPDQVTPGHDEDADSWIVTGRVGHDWQSGRIVFGVFGEANWLDAGTTHFADADFLYGGGSRLGYLINDRLLAYVNAGVELTDYSGLDTKVDPFLGGGLELLLADGWSVAGEGRWTFADDGDLPASVSNNDPVTVRALIVKKF